MVGERRAGTGGRRAAATDQTRALAAGAVDRIARRQSPPGLPASAAAEGNGEGRVKGTDGRAGE